MALNEEGAPAVSLDDVARLLDRLQAGAAHSAAYYPVFLFLHARLETLRGRRDEARRLLVLSAGRCAAAGLRFYEGRCRYELRSFGGVGQLREAHRLFAACGAAGWKAATEAAMQGAAAEPADASWNWLSLEEVAAANTKYPGSGDHTQIYDEATVRATQAAGCDALPAALQFVRDQLRVPQSDPQLGAFLSRLEEDLPRIAEALLGGASSTDFADAATVTGGKCFCSIVATTVDATCAAVATPAQLPTCLVCEIEGRPVTDVCLKTFAYSAVAALVSTALIAGGVKTESI